MNLTSEAKYQALAKLTEETLYPFRWMGPSGGEVYLVQMGAGTNGEGTPLQVATMHIAPGPGRPPEARLLGFWGRN